MQWFKLLIARRLVYSVWYVRHNRDSLAVNGKEWRSLRRAYEVLSELIDTPTNEKPMK
jgi:hypothetical protein